MQPAGSGKGKEFTVHDDKGPREIILRSKLGVFVCSAYDSIDNLKDKIFGNATFLLQTQKSHLIIAATENYLFVFDLKERTVIA